MSRIPGTVRSLSRAVVLAGLLGGSVAEAGFPFDWCRWWGVGTGPGYHAGAACHGGGSTCVECGAPAGVDLPAGSEAWLPAGPAPAAAEPTPAAAFESASRAAPRGVLRTARVPARTLPTRAPSQPAVRGY